jgi:hypothetical protein
LGYCLWAVRCIDCTTSLGLWRDALSALGPGRNEFGGQVGSRAYPHRGAWECARAQASAGSFSLLRLQVDGPAEADAVAAALQDVLRPMDLLTIYAPAHFDLLLPSLDAKAGAAMA